MKILSLLIILLFSLSAFAQTDLPIIGKISDLSGKKTVYILAETTKSREMIQKILDKDKTFEIVPDAGKADFILEFKQISKDMNVGDNTAEMAAYFYNSDKKKVIGWSETKNYYKITLGKPARKNEIYLTQQFLKAVNPK